MKESTSDNIFLRLLLGVLLLFSAPLVGAGGIDPRIGTDHAQRRPPTPRDKRLPTRSTQPGAVTRPQAPPERGRTGIVLGLRPEIFFCETSDPQCRTSINTFFLDDIRDLYVFVTWPYSFGEHVQTVEFILPDGHLYQRKETTFTVSAPRPRKHKPRRGPPVRTLTALSAADKSTQSASPAPKWKLATGDRQVAPVPRGQLQSVTRGVSAGIRKPLPRRDRATVLASRSQSRTVSRGVPAAITVLPVAGTFITQRRLAGTWTVRVLLDDKPVLFAQFTLKTEGEN